MCAVSHNNIYPIIEGLDPTIASGNLVLRATRPIDDLFADGWFAALGYSRLIELVFTLVGWSLTGALAVRSLIEAAQQNAQTYADAMEALDVDGGEPNATD